MAVYRNLQEQVYENTKDIEELQVEKVDADQAISAVTPVINTKIDNIRKIHSDDKQNAYVEFSNDSSWYSSQKNIPHVRIHQKEGSESSTNTSNNIKLDRLGVFISSYSPHNNSHIELTTGGAELHLHDYYASLVTTNKYNPDDEYKTRSLWYYGEYFKHLRYHDDTFDEYKLDLPTKSGTLALIEDIPGATGYVKAHTIENDNTEADYTAKIDLGSGRSGSNLTFTAPGDLGDAKIEIINAYTNDETIIRFQADKIKVGNTELTENQLQRLLELIV